MLSFISLRYFPFNPLMCQCHIDVTTVVEKSLALKWWVVPASSPSETCREEGPFHLLKLRGWTSTPNQSADIRGWHISKTDCSYIALLGRLC